MPTRSALLIGNNTGYKASTFLRGVDKDIINYTNFLQSDIGGKWMSSEIKILHNKKRREIINAIYDCVADYSFVVFSGHGFIYSKDELTYICVSDGYINENELNTNLLKQTLILDCCRETNYEGIGFLGESFEKGDPLAKSFTEKKIINPRTKFNNALIESSNGQFRGYACEIDQTSGDNPNSGGVYSTALINAGKNFGLRNQIKNVWLPIRQAHKIAAKELSNDPFTIQTPSYLTIPQTMKLTHPFAVSNKVSNLW